MMMAQTPTPPLVRLAVAEKTNNKKSPADQSTVTWWSQIPPDEKLLLPCPKAK